MNSLNRRVKEAPTVLMSTTSFSRDSPFRPSW